MKRRLVVMCTIALGAALTAPATADTLGEKVKTGVEKTKDAAAKIGHTIGATARDVKDRVLGHQSEGPEDHRGATRHHDVMAAQQALRDKGHDPGMIDGRMGWRTRAAVTDYQKAEGLNVTGQLDGDTRAKLGI